MPISNEKEFWSVGKSKWNRWQVRKASCDDPYTYELIEDLGPVKKLDPQTGEFYEPIKKVGIEFDGEFRQPRGDIVVRIHTTDHPWIFILMTDGTLYVKRTGVSISEEPPTVLDINVTDASICRSWVNNSYGTDQGVVIAYCLTDGSVVVRQYHKVANVYVWDGPQVLHGVQNETHVKSFRLNDFRIAVYLEDSRKLWISTRNYIGNMIKDEYVELEIQDPVFKVFSVRHSPQSFDQLQVLGECYFIDDSHVGVDFNFPIFDYDSTWNDITWTGSSPAGQDVKALDFQNNTLVIELKVPMENHRQPLSFKCRAVNRKGYYISENAKPIWPELTMSKAREKLVSPDVYFGTANLRIETSSIYFPWVGKKEYKETVEETVLLDITGTISFPWSLMVKKEGFDTELLVLELDVSSVIFPYSMVGDTPI